MSIQPRNLGPAATRTTRLPRILFTLAVLAAPSISPGRAGPAAPAGESRTFALVINGDAAAKHRDNVSLALEVLSRMGVEADRLYVLSGTPGGAAGRAGGPLPAADLGQHQGGHPGSRRRRWTATTR